MPPIFELIQELGQVSDDEMHRVFNCGIGMVMVAGPAHVDAIQRALGEPSWVIGEIRQ
jgi:phosphoribosylformylglycinamidine cyclo-ligase